VFSRNVDHVDGPSKGADVNKTCRLAMPNIVLLPCRTLTIEPKSWITVPQTETAHRFQSKPTMARPWFDYIMGTRIKANPDLAKCNPLGVKLRTFV
jgi:hypothetical protein